ncbi:MAG: GNAT family N-acetyltransferase [Pyrinomonadaceae bacterium]|jgi:ribosomal protein S18 acetylase RimI-like enzyme|nr:GNAT family N-acetyltransferase [Pyrinomonadaceae bacterium]
MPAKIRRAMPGDENAIARFAVRLVEQHVGYDAERFSLFATVEGGEDFYRSRISASESVIMVVESDEEIVGFAYVESDSLNYAEMLRNGAWLHDIYISEVHRSRGLGESLLAAAIDAAKELGAEKLLLSVAAKNAIGQKLFGRAGFRPTMIEMTLNLVDSL